MSIAAAALMLLASYLYFIGFLGFMLLWMRSGKSMERSTGLIMVGTALLAATFHFIANVFLSRDDRRYAMTKRAIVHRWGLWIAPGAMVVGMLMLMLVLTSARVALLGNIDSVANGMIYLALPTCPILTFFRLRWLATRLDRPRLARQIRIAAWGDTISLIYFIAGLFVTMLFVDHPDPRMFAVLVLPSIVLALWSVVLLGIVTVLFFNSAGIARGRWRAADASLID